MRPAINNSGGKAYCEVIKKGTVSCLRWRKPEQVASMKIDGCRFSLNPKPLFDTFALTEAGAARYVLTQRENRLLLR